MKERLSSFFGKLRSGKNKRSAIILTIVALVEVIALMVVSTSAWVESINSIKVYNIVPGVVESAINQKVNLVSSSSNTYNLDKYFRPAGGYHLCGASSTDGKTMYFPEIVSSGDPSIYRTGGINDKNVNYISFTIRTQTKVSLAFDQVPTISFGGTDLSGDDRKLVRFSIGDNAGNFRVYSLYDTKFTESVPAAEDGTTETTTVYPFADYVKGKDRAVETTANGYLSFNMWIQDPKGVSKTVYDNKALSVTNLKLVIVTPFTVKAASTTGTNGAYQLNNTGGNVAIENSAYGAEATFYAVPGQSVALHALASESNGFSLLGWQTTNPNGSTSASVISGSNTDPYNYTIPSNGNTTTIYAIFSNVHNIYMKPEYQFKGDNNAYVRFAAYVFGINASGQNVGTWYNMTGPITWKNDGGYYRCTYRGNATSIIFCYMSPSTPADATLNSGSVNVFDTYRYLQTYDLQVPSTPGEYGYHITARQVLNHNRWETGINEDTGYGTNKLVGFWLHNHVKVNVAYTSTSASGVSEKIYPSLTDTSDATGKAEWYDDAHKNKYLFVDGKAYQDLDSSGNIIPQYKYEKKVTLTAELASNSIYQFDGWYSSAAGTGTTNRLTTAMTYEITAPDNNAYTGTDTEKQVTYYAKYSLKPAATVNIYVTPRAYWSGYFLHVWDGNGTTLADVIPSYDAATGYYKATVTTRSTSGVYAILAKDSNYTSQTSDITVLSSVTLGSTYNRRISTSNSVTDRGNYRCWWFIDNTSSKWIKTDWDRSNDPSRMVLYAGANYEMTRQDTYSWICETSNFTSGTLYFKEIPRSQGTNGTVWNQWYASYSSTKSQCKATSGGSNVSTPLS